MLAVMFSTLMASCVDGLWSEVTKTLPVYINGGLILRLEGAFPSTFLLLSPSFSDIVWFSFRNSDCAEYADILLCCYGDL